VVVENDGGVSEGGPIGSAAADEGADAAVDVDALARRLLELTGTSYAIQGVRRAETGFVNGTLMVDATPGPLVVKVQSDAVAVYGSDPILEPLVLRELGGAGAAVPAVVAVDGDTATLGAPWFAMERIDGVGLPDDAFTGFMAEGWFFESTPAERRRVCETFVDRLAEVHAVPAAVLAGLDRGGSASRAIDYLRASVEDAAPGRVPREHRLLDLLVEQLPVGADDDVTPCMGDARMANALVRDGEVVALVDWEIAYLGNPAADIGYAVNNVDWLTHTTGTRLEGIPTSDETWDRWERHTGRQVPTPDRRYWERFGAMIITITATRVIASFLTGPDDPGPEDVNNMLTHAEGLFDVR
jgi:aminoglycoside phosphotransferase (APT) family kinase protein